MDRQTGFASRVPIREAEQDWTGSCKNETERKLSNCRVVPNEQQKKIANLTKISRLFLTYGVFEVNYEMTCFQQKNKNKNHVDHSVLSGIPTSILMENVKTIRSAGGFLTKCQDSRNCHVFFFATIPDN